MSFICFDTEDNSKELLASGGSGFDKVVTQIAAISTRRKKFHNTGEVKPFLKWLAEQPEQIVYAHNLQYDLGNLFSQDLDDLDCTMVGGRLIKAVWHNKVFCDSFNIWPMSAKKVGEKFGIEKLKMDVHSKAYVFRDVEIINAAMSFAWALASDFGLESLPPTLGGLCVKVWKSMGGVNCHDTNPLSKDAYYGGRVELFKHKNDTADICYSDINSLYPAMMLKEFPSALLPWQEERLPKFGIARVTVKMPKTELGVLPYRDSEGRILFPYGQFTGTWTVVEIQAALARGGKIIATHEIFGTDDSIRPYYEFVMELYERRKSAKTEPEKVFFKLLMNNLYGRLGTGGVIGRTVWRTEENENDGIPYGVKVLVNYQMPLSEETNWAHAAHVTAYGRIALLEYMERIGAQNMIYCDTDSTIFDCPGRKIPFAISDELGAMKLEAWETECETYAPKEYKLGKKFKAKGVPVALAEQFLTKGRADFDLPFKLRESIRFYDRGNIRRLSVWRNVEKFRKGKYDKKKRSHNRYIPLLIREE